MADSGELQELHKRCSDLTQSVESGYIKVMDQLDRTLQQVCEAEQDIYDDLIDSEVEGLQRLNDDSNRDAFLDAVSFVDGETPLENYEIVRRVAEQKGDSDIVTAEKSLRSLLQARAQLMSAKAQVQRAILDKVADGNTGANQIELDEYEGTARKYGIAAEDVESSDNVYLKQLQDVQNGDMGRLLDDIENCARSQAERTELYSEFDSENNVDGFRSELLKHLAGNIIVKEHRLRYQKEQFDRFVASLSFTELKNSKMTLREFSKSYSRLIEAQTQSSHNYRSPKIEANYDDFNDQTIRPLNATIFFYFFSANRSGKTWAQWMLSSVRYPNDRMRRAYMRFFA